MSKYRAVRTVVDGITFDSKKEAAYYKQLKVMEAGGFAKDIRLQPKFDCVVNGKKICTYRADFEYLAADPVDPIKGELNVRRIVDVKGYKTPIYKLKKKLVEAIHNVDIIEV
tara:strand:+ start:382 stop:717 length:336 start_codon:yes stop_codon:yes gene_type:complete